MQETNAEFGLSEVEEFLALEFRSLIAETLRQTGASEDVVLLGIAHALASYAVEQGIDGALILSVAADQAQEAQESQEAIDVINEARSELTKIYNRIRGSGAEPT